MIPQHDGKRFCGHSKRASHEQDADGADALSTALRSNAEKAPAHGSEEIAALAAELFRANRSGLSLAESWLLAVELLKAGDYSH